MRRKFHVEKLSEVIEECQRLFVSGYTQRENWSLGQICCHIRLTMERNMDGYPAWMTLLGFPLRPVLRRIALPRLLAGKSPSGLPTAGMFVPPGDLDDRLELDRLKTCVSRFASSSSQMHAHPGFGRMTNEEFARFHAAHAAHHLSFLEPRAHDSREI